MRTLLEDLRFSCREWRKRPGLALTATVSLALGRGQFAEPDSFYSCYGVVAFDRRFRGFGPCPARFLADPLKALRYE